MDTSKFMVCPVDGIEKKLTHVITSNHFYFLNEKNQLLCHRCRVWYLCLLIPLCTCFKFLKEIVCEEKTYFDP